MYQPNQSLSPDPLVSDLKPSPLPAGLAGRIAYIQALLLTPELPAALLRFSLGTVYLWFGALKLTGHSPVLALLKAVYGDMVTTPAYLGLALFEVGLGIAFFMGGRVRRWAAAASAMHLLGTLSVPVLAPALAFDSGFPFLTMTGEFVMKNVVLIAASAAIWLQPTTTTSRPPARVG